MGEAPKLQMMIQILLADRFKLTLHREMKEVPVYNLVVEKPGKIKLSDDQTPPGDPPVGINASALPRGVMLNCLGTAIPISALATCLPSGVGRPVIDKTGLKGLFDIPQSGAGPNVEIAPLLLEQLGLKLESAKAPLEVLVVDHAEKPSEN